MEKANLSGNFAIKCLAIEDFPAPEGAVNKINFCMLES
jgi:hypothetical protein